MSYLYLFIFSTLAVLAYVAADLSWKQYKTGKDQSTSIMPTIPLVPLFIVSLALILEKLGFAYGIYVAYALSGIMLIVSVGIFIYVYFETKNT